MNDLNGIEETAIVLGLFGFIYFTLRFLILYITTKGTFVKEKIYYDEKGNPKDILRVEYNYFWGDHTTLKWHPDHARKTVKKLAKDPFYKYITDQINTKGFWNEQDGVPEDVMKSSREYRKKLKDDSQHV